VSSAEEVLTLLAESTHAKTASASASPFSRAYGVRVVLAWSAKFVAAEKMAAAREHLLPRAWRALDGALAQSATLTTPETVPNGIGLKVLRAMRTIAASPTSRLTAYDGALTRVLASLLASYEADDAAAVGNVLGEEPAGIAELQRRAVAGCGGDVAVSGVAPGGADGADPGHPHKRLGLVVVQPRRARGAHSACVDRRVPVTRRDLNTHPKLR
jgi:hypothetical protein